MKQQKPGQASMKHAGSGTGGLDGFGQIPGQTLPPSLTLSILNRKAYAW